MVGRNDPCSCGSGKKYKKCCLNKQNVVQLQQAKEERYYEQKQKLQKKLYDFIGEKVSFTLHQRLLNDFRARLKMKGSPDSERTQMLFMFWLQFFYRFENGLRGVEWFYKERATRLPLAEQELAKSWTDLKLRVIQAIDLTDDKVIFEDVYSKETFPMAYPNENLPAYSPWFGTIALVEQVGDEFYFNGIRAFDGPVAVSSVKKKIEELIEETGLSYDQILVDYYPEIITAFSDYHKDVIGESVVKEIAQITISAKVMDEEVVGNYFYHDENYDVDEWNATTKRFSLVGNWYSYVDSELEGEVIFAEVFGQLLIEDGALSFITFHEQVAEQFHEVLAQFKTAVINVNEESEYSTVPHELMVKNYLINLSPDSPQYAAAFAQQVDLFDIHQRLPIFDQLSLQELVQNGREEDANFWLMQSEYSTYEQLKNQFDDMEKTVNFNVVRKQLGLTPSPFVTGGESRKSEITNSESPKKRQYIVEQQDIPLYEDLGFTPKTINNFYATDIVEYCKETIAGKSKSTVRKYVTSLFDVREALEKVHFEQWEECDLPFWQKLVTHHFTENNPSFSKTQAKDFLSAVRHFTKWLDKNKNTNIAQDVQLMVKEEEPRLIELASAMK